MTGPGSGHRWTCTPQPGQRPGRPAGPGHGHPGPGPRRLLRQAQPEPLLCAVLPGAGPGPFPRGCTSARTRPPGQPAHRPRRRRRTAARGRQRPRGGPVGSPRRPSTTSTAGRASISPEPTHPRLVRPGLPLGQPRPVRGHPAPRRRCHLPGHRIQQVGHDQRRGRSAGPLGRDPRRKHPLGQTLGHRITTPSDLVTGLQDNASVAAELASGWTSAELSPLTGEPPVEGRASSVARTASRWPCPPSTAPRAHCPPSAPIWAAC